MRQATSVQFPSPQQHSKSFDCLGLLDLTGGTSIRIDSGTAAIAFRTAYSGFVVSNCMLNY